MTTGATAAAPRILLIEDNPADVYLIRESFKETGLHCSIENINDGEDALAYVRRVPFSPLPDLIILDLNLPKAEGSDILEAIRASRSYSDVPVVIFTSSDSPQDKLHAAQFGARKYIRKPSTLDAFLQIGGEIKEFLPPRDPIV